MAAAWRSMMGVRITGAGGGRFLFEFPSQNDTKRVLDDWPWAFENNSLICTRFEDGAQPDTTILNKLPIWIEIYDLPFGYSTDMILEQIGNVIGSFIKSDQEMFHGYWRKFYRIRVALDIEKPLRRRLKFIKRDGEWVWINFRYERLHNFCFCCGVLGHTARLCARAILDSIPPENFPYGPELRAGIRRQLLDMGSQWLLTDQRPSIITTPPFSQQEQTTTVQDNNCLVPTQKRRWVDIVSSPTNSLLQDEQMTDALASPCSAGSEHRTRPPQWVF